MLDAFGETSATKPGRKKISAKRWISTPLPARPAPGLHSMLSAGITLRPGISRVKRLFQRMEPDLRATACDRTVIARAEVVEVPPAIMLPGQMERLRGTMFGNASEVARDFIGGFAVRQGPTLAHHFRNVLLLDGVLYNENTTHHLRARSSVWPLARAPGAIARATLYESWEGNRWFGNWLGETCLTYLLAEQFGDVAVTSHASGHRLEYEYRLNMAAPVIEAAYFDELTLFEDKSQTANKRKRALEMRRRLIGNERARHPGVFLLRGADGDHRLLRNEQAIAARLASRRGFTVLDPLASSISTIIDACASAQVVAGVEGSHLAHGLVSMPADACVLVIQPPTRVVSVLKGWADRQGQRFAVIIAEGNSREFVADIGEVERTLDLL